MHGTDDVHDELRAFVRPDRGNRSGHGLGRRARAREMTPGEHEHDDQKQRAGDQAPARRGEGIQHVVKSGNDDVTRGYPKWIETVSMKRVTNHSAAA
jgi:hypothetical protein